MPSVRLCLSLLLSLSAPHLLTRAAAAPVTIDALVADVVASHPELTYYQAELDAVRSEGRAARAWHDPELSVSFGRKSARASSSGLSDEGNAWAVSLAQTFEWPGRIALRKAVAERDLALAELALEGFRTELGARARALATGLLASRERARAAEEVAARLREVKEAFVARESGGLTPQLEIRVIEAQELMVQRRATEAQLELDSALIALNLLRGAQPEATLDIEGRSLVLAGVPDLDAIFELALTRNVAFRTRAVELERQGLRVTLARHEGRPSVTLAPFIEEERAGERERTVGLGVTVPLPVGGRTGATVDASIARRTQAEAVLKAARLELERELIAALQAYRVNRDDMQQWPVSLAEKFREAAATADRHYRLGAVPVATYVELQSAYLDAVEHLARIEQSTLEAGMRLEALTSGAWRAVEVTP